MGLSGVKTRYVLNLAEAVASGNVPLDAFDAWDDDAIVARLTSVKGVGTWTAEMFLIFALNRPDVLPVGDLGVRVALRDHHGLAELPRPAQCRELAAPGGRSGPSPSGISGGRSRPRSRRIQRRKRRGRGRGDVRELRPDQSRTTG